ncbi:MAG: acyl dehydratase [Cellvibrionaceae bacterium]|jgi:acyl dehydratase
MSDYNFSTISDFIGKEVGVSDWVTIDQAQINAFADATGDHQWIHVDIEKCKAESPLGTTIAHGYLTLSLVPMLSAQIGTLPSGLKHVLNYGADKIRFLNPVPAGSRVRMRAVLMKVTPKGEGRYLFKTQNTIEIEGADKPAMIAESLALAFT